MWETCPVNETRLLVLFDLDGTLVDPAGSITGGIAAALAGAGLPVPGPERLSAMVGPALTTSLRDLAGVPEDRLDEVIAAYRAGYRSSGMAESRPYPGIPEVLAELQGRCLLAVATQKPEGLAHELLRLQGLDGFFASIHGSPDDERTAAPDGKASIVAAALERHRGAWDHAVMIGDRSHDVHGAAANGLPCIGITWGFAADGELEDAGAAEVVTRAEDLPAAITRTAAAPAALTEAASAAALDAAGSREVAAHGRL